MIRPWRRLFGIDKSLNPATVARLEASKKELEAVKKQGEEVDKLSSYLADRRSKNHFGDALTISFTPRRNHV